MQQTQCKIKTCLVSIMFLFKPFHFKHNLLFVHSFIHILLPSSTAVNDTLECFTLSPQTLALAIHVQVQPILAYSILPVANNL